MTAAYISPTNGYVPSFDESGKLQVGYSRNQDSFALNQYVQIIKVKRNLGYYLRLSAKQAARMLSSSRPEFIWPRGNDAPTGEWNREGHEFVSFLTERVAFPVNIDYDMVEQADWDVKEQYSKILAQQAMTSRTLEMLTTATTSGNYDTGHADTCTNWSGGKWDVGTSTSPYIMSGLLAAAKKIQKDTIGVIQPRDLILVISPSLAIGMAKSAELHDYVKSSPYAKSGLVWEDKGLTGSWGVPPVLYGFKVIIEDAVRNAGRKGDTDSNDYILGDTAMLVARPGSLVSVGGGANFGTLAFFMKEEMNFESKDDVQNRRHQLRLVEDWDKQVIAPSSGALFTDCSAA